MTKTNTPQLKQKRHPELAVPRSEQSSTTGANQLPASLLIFTPKFTIIK